MRKSFESQAKIMSDGEINKETKETEIKPEEFLNELSEILTAMESARADSDLQIKETIRKEVSHLGIDIGEKEMREIIDNQQKEFRGLKDKFLKCLIPHLALILQNFIFWSSSNKEIIEEISFTNRHVARDQMIKKGITDNQRRAYKRGVSEFLNNAIYPYDYKRSVKDRVKDLLPHGKEIRKRYEERHEGNRNREDAWRLYLGLRQKHNTFGISDHRPVKSKDDKYYFKINRFISGAYYHNITEEKDSSLIRWMIDKAILGKKGFRPEDKDHGIMGHYKIDQGQDEKGFYVSYYDIWDIAMPGAGLIGKKFEIYDRIYYDPKTFKVIEPTSTTSK